MRNRKEIEKERIEMFDNFANPNISINTRLSLEVLLDIRDLLIKLTPKKKHKTQEDKKC